MAGGMVYLSFGLALFATVGIVFSTLFYEWKRNSVQSSQANFINIRVSEGLWVRCTSQQTGQFQCDTYDTSIIGLPPQIQGMRAMMCLASLFIVMATICSIVAMPCTGALADNQKVMTARVGGCLGVLAGALCIASVSWYAANIIYEFFSVVSYNDTFKFEFGTALYVGWVAGSLALLSGILLACCNCGAKDDEDDYRYAYKPSKPPATTTNRAAEYV